MQSDHPLILAWRLKFNEQKSFGAKELDELESHMLEEIDFLMVRKDFSEQEAFDKAVKVIGRQDMLEDEFKKVRPFSWITFQSWIIKWLVNLRDEENLIESQKRYIKRWSFGPIVWFLYAPFRYLWYIFGFLALISILISTVWRLLNFSFSSERFLLYTGLLLFRFVVYILFCWLGRRLSWNKGKWKTFKSFTRSEIIWNCIGLLLIGLFFYVAHKTAYFTYFVKNLQIIFSRPVSPNQPYLKPFP